MLFLNDAILKFVSKFVDLQNVIILFSKGHATRRKAASGHGGEHSG